MDNYEGYMQVNLINYDQNIIQALGSTKEERDPDGFYSFQKIQSILKVDIEAEYNNLSKNNRDSLQFLAKVGVAAQRLGFDKKEARDLISISVELYAKNLGINPLSSRIEDRKTVLEDLIFRAVGYAGMGQESTDSLKDLIKASMSAYDAWVMYELIMNRK